MKQPRFVMSLVLVITTIVPGGLSWASETAGVTEPGIRAFFAGSSELPDEIAFGEFVAIVNATYGSADLRDQGIVAAALGFELETKADFAKARKRLDFFLRTFRSMKMEQLGAKISVLCSNDRASRSNDQIHRAMDDADDIGQAVLAKHYLVAMNSLRAGEQQAFAAFLNGMKGGISYVKVDSRHAYDGAQSNVQAAAERACNEYARNHQTLKGIQ